MIGESILWVSRTGSEPLVGFVLYAYDMEIKNYQIGAWTYFVEADSLFVAPCLYSLHIVCFKYIVCKTTGLAQNLKVA